MSDALLDGLEKLRSIIGEPIYISSGYRCPRHNFNIGGAPNSQHVAGTACDIYVQGMSAAELAKKCKTIFDGIGTYYEADFVHVDMRDGGNSIGWYLWTDRD